MSWNGKPYRVERLEEVVAGDEASGTHYFPVSYHKTGTLAFAKAKKLEGYGFTAGGVRVTVDIDGDGDSWELHPAYRLLTAAQQPQSAREAVVKVGAFTLTKSGQASVAEFLKKRAAVAGLNLTDDQLIELAVEKSQGRWEVG